MKLFNHIAVEISSMCNRTCVFCPNHRNSRPDEQMPIELIEKIARELKAEKWRGRLSLYNYNEPTRDPRLIEIVKLISSILPSASIMISTNCDYFKRSKQIADLYDAGVRQIVFNIYSAADGSASSDSKIRAGIVAATRRAETIEKWVEELGLETGKGMYDHAPKGSRRARVERKFGITPETKKIGVFELSNRAGNIPWFKESKVLEKTCVRPWRSMIVDWTGKVVLCCNDYHSSVVMGDLNTDKIVNVWNSEAYNRYRVALQRKDRNIPLCSSCEYNGGYYTHMLEKVSFGSVKEDSRQIELLRSKK